MLIAIVDDENLWTNRIEKVLKPYMNRTGRPYEIRKFDSGKEFLRAAEQDIFDMLFLDVKMDEMNGLEIAEAFRVDNPNALLIFVSSIMQYARVGYRFDATRYLLKDNIEKDFDECMEALFKEKRLQEKSINLKGGKEEEIRLSDIIYVESQKRKVEIHLASDESIKLSNEKLDEFENRLDSREFIRVHQSFLVNLRYVVKVDNEVKLRNGKTISISRSRAEEAKRQYSLWLG